MKKPYIVAENRTKPAEKEQPKPALKNGLPPCKPGESDDIVPGWRIAPGTYPKPGETPFTVVWENDIRHEDLRAKLTESDLENLADAGLGNVELAEKIKRLTSEGLPLSDVAKKVDKSLPYVKQFSSKLNT